MRIHFVGRDLKTRWPDLDWITADDIDTAAARFTSGVDQWIVQTYLRLAAPLARTGFETSISEQFEPNAINITHRDTLDAIALNCRDYYTVAIRAERAPVRMARWTVVPNLSGERGLHTKYLPGWPQPGLRARDRLRGSRIHRIRSETLRPLAREAELRAGLERRGIELVTDAEHGNDYRAVDLVVGADADAPTMLRTRPASTLVNAWHAQVPALLRRACGFDDLRYSPLDFVAARDAGEVLAAIDFLRDNPGVYQAMIANGIVRAQMFSVGAIEERWVAFLRDQVAPDARRWFGSGAPAQWRKLTSLAALARQHAASRLFKLRIGLERLTQVA